MTDPIHTVADARALVRDAVVLLEGVIDTDAPALLPDTLRIVLADGAEIVVRIAVHTASPAAAADDGALAFGNGIDWSEAQQRAALEQGWCLILCGDGAVTIEADTDGDRFLGADMHAQALSHVEEGARGGHAFTDDYTALCKWALLVVEQTAADQETFAHTPDRCPTKHYNRGDDRCGDCGEYLA